MRYSGPFLGAFSYQPGAELSRAGHGLRSGVPAYPRIETELHRGANPSPDQASETASRERNGSYRFQRHIASASESDPPDSVPDFPPPPGPDSTPHVRVASQTVRRFPARRSRANSRIVSNIAKRGSVWRGPRVEPDFFHQRGQAFKEIDAKIALVLQTASAASNVHPPTKTERRRNSFCSASFNRP